MRVSVSNVCKSFPDRGLVLQDLTCEFESGRIYAVMGASGCGKSTLLRILTGELEFKADGGSVRYDGEEMSPGVLERIGYVSQDPTLMFLPWRTVESHYEFMKQARGPRWKEGLSRREVVERTELVRELQKKARVRTLSGGMKKRLALGMLLCTSFDFLLLDEPFSGIDLNLRQQLWDALVDYCERDREQRPTVVFTTHDIHEAAVLADKVMFLAHRPAEVGGTTLMVHELSGTSVFSSSRPTTREKDASLTTYERNLRDEYSKAINWEQM